jgi:hypothetical protein
MSGIERHLQIEECKLAWRATKFVDESRCKVAAEDSTEIVVWNLEEISMLRGLEPDDLLVR